MMREVFLKHTFGLNKEFRFRGAEPGRLENFSDACFALAITLLLISTSPPSDFSQLKRFVWDLIPFCLCITLIVLIWHQHFIFFYRYGLRNPKVILLNSCFLVIVLFYVYPLKYLTKGILFPISFLFGQTHLLPELKEMFKGSQIADIMIIYGIGFASVFVVLALMYRYALKNAQALELDAIEIFDTRTSMRTNLLMASVPALSTLLAFILRNHWLAGTISGFTYFLYPLIMGIHGRVTHRKRKLLLEPETELVNT